MGLIVRHTGAPFAAAETLSAGTAEAPDGLELDIKAFYAEFNGAVDNVNLKADANLDGTKLSKGTLALAKVVNDAVDATVLLDDSIEDVKFAANSVTVAKIEANALSNHEISTANNTSIGLTLGEAISDTIVTTEGSGAVLVYWMGRLRDESQPLDSPAIEVAFSSNVQFRLRRGGTTLHTSTSLARSGAYTGTGHDEITICFTYMDTGRPGGVSVLYTMDILRVENAISSAILDQQRLFLVNLGA